MSKFKELVSKLMKDGKSETAAKKIAYTIGANKYGKVGMARKAAAGMKILIYLQHVFTHIKNQK